VSRVRVEKARQLLSDPNQRVSEIAYQTGFQSLSHFNRCFKRITGQSPTACRAELQTV
jgi:AraC-like DNA-binding protein